MRDKRHTPGKNYKLISAYIRLNQNQHEEEIQNQLFDRRLKGLHLFCVIIFGVFILDGQLPSERIKTEIKGSKTLTFQHNEISTLVNGKLTSKDVVSPYRIQITTGRGVFITNEVTGYEKAGTPVELLITPLFKVNTELYFTEANCTAHRWLNFSGNFIFWPIMAFLISFLCLVTKKFYGSTTLAVIALLNMVPFFVVVYRI